MRITSIVILSYNTYVFMKLCIQSIRQYTAPGTYELIVVDNASVDGSVQWLQEQSDIRCVFNTQNMGFPKGCNQGMELAAGDTILLLNSDTVVTPRWLDQLTAALYSDATIGAVGCVTNACSNGQQIEVPYQKIRDMFSFAEKYNHTDSKRWKQTMTLMDFCLLFRREVYEELGGLEVALSSGNGEEDAYSLRIWNAGYKMLLCKDTFIHHFGCMSFRQEKSEEEQSVVKNRNLDENKICFITCVNNEEQYAQCVKQLQSLHIPDGMQIESLAVCGAQYMTEGYQKAMLQSDAKYKIYLHQDVWILQENFLEVLVRAFHSHPEYGIAGVVGSADLPANAIWWESSHLLGTIYDDHTTRMGLYRYQLSDVGQEAAALDGLLLATQYDVNWRTDVFQKWHFYDLSQCMEFRKKGYQAFVLPQRLPFCMHFCGQNAMRGYDEERTKFMQIYG